VSETEIQNGRTVNGREIIVEPMRPSQKWQKGVFEGQFEYWGVLRLTEKQVMEGKEAEFHKTLPKGPEIRRCNPHEHQQIESVHARFSRSQRISSIAHRSLARAPFSHFESYFSQILKYFEILSDLPERQISTFPTSVRPMFLHHLKPSTISIIPEFLFLKFHQSQRARKT
jgi:hypothetical protein